MKRLLTVHEMSAKLRMSNKAIYHKRKRGQLPPAIVMGDKTLRWVESEVNTWLRKQREKGRS